MLVHYHLVLWLVPLLILDSWWVQGRGANATIQNDTAVGYLPLLREAYQMLETASPDNAGGTASWHEVDAISRAFAKALAAAPMRIQSMNALLSFLLVVPEEARVHMVEAAVEVLLDEGLADSASCLLGNVASTSPADSQAAEGFYRRSLEILPQNPITVLSFGFKLQSQGRSEDAFRLYDDQLGLNPNLATLYLSRASVCPHHFDSIQDSHDWYKRLRNSLAEAFVMLKGLDAPLVKDLHLSLQHQPSIGWQYLGFPLAPLMTLLNKNILVMDPDLTRVAPGLSPVRCWSGGPSSESSMGGQDSRRDGSDGAGVRFGRRIRLGIVMERRANVSPERVFGAVLRNLDRHIFEVVVFAQDTPQVPSGAAILAAADRVVFFPGHEGVASIGESVRAGGRKTVSLGMPNLHLSREVVQAEQLDCILYMALGQSLFQHLLSIGRLAPLQLSFGLGHPVTSGHEGVDFFVSSELFETARETDERGESRNTNGGKKHAEVAALDGVAPPSALPNATVPDSLITGNHGGGMDVGDGVKRLRDGREDTSALQQRDSPPPPGVFAGSTSMYSEQVVLFDSFTGVFQPPRYPDPARVQSAREQLVVLAIGAGTSPAIEHGHERENDARRTGREETPGPRVEGNVEFARPSVEEDGGERNRRSSSARNLDDAKHGGIRFYHCFQDPKKFHPAFDFAMRGVLDQEPGAHLLVSVAARVHYERWKRTLGPEAVKRVLFLPKLDHPEMMEVVAACDVMLAPWGWGAGITSFEALAMGLPVVTLPSRESVLHFSMGQIAVLGLEDELVAKDPDDYVSKAVRLGTDRPYRDSVSAMILKRRDQLFGESVAAEVAEEWGRFLERGVRMACPTTWGSGRLSGDGTRGGAAI